MKQHITDLERENAALKEAFDTKDRVHDKLLQDYVRLKKHIEKLNVVVDRLCELASDAHRRFSFEFSRALHSAINDVTDVQNTTYYQESE